MKFFQNVWKKTPKPIDPEQAVTDENQPGNVNVKQGPEPKPKGADETEIILKEGTNAQENAIIEEETDYFLPIRARPKNAQDKKIQRMLYKPIIRGAAIPEKKAEVGNYEYESDKLFSEDRENFKNFTDFTFLGEGGYGKVYSAKTKETNEEVAIKICPVNEDGQGIPKDIIRELGILTQLNHHPNIVEYLGFMFKKEKNLRKQKEEWEMVLIMEKMDFSLYDVLQNIKGFMPMKYLTNYAKQIANGLKWCYKNGITHRDLKPENVLISKENEVKIADFGQSRFMDTDVVREYTKTVTTVWYRAPELLFGAQKYTSSVDIWSFGCLLVEMKQKRPLLSGDDDISQLKLIYKTFGTPTREEAEVMKEYPLFGKLNLPRCPPKIAEQIFEDFEPNDGIELLRNMFQYDPEKRIHIYKILVHPFLQSAEPEILDPITSLFRPVAFY